MSDSATSSKASDECTLSQRLRDADKKADQARSLIWFLKGFGGPGSQGAEVTDLAGYMTEYCDVALALMWDSYEESWSVMRELEEREKAEQEEAEKEAATEGQS